MWNIFPNAIMEYISQCNYGKFQSKNKFGDRFMIKHDKPEASFVMNIDFRTCWTFSKESFFPRAIFLLKWSNQNNSLVWITSHVCPK